ncbi:MAG: hypothetical protein ACQET1_03195 [Gemmatimonadota bacterium]
MGLKRVTRTRLTTILILLLVLVTGSVLGIAVDRRLEARDATGEKVAPGREKDDRQDRPPDAREGPSENRRRLIVEQVSLSEAQHLRVDSIVSHYRQRMRELERELEDELRRAYLPRYRELLEGTREEIKGVLTPAQRMEYDSLLVEYDRRREERRNRDSHSDSSG